MKLKKKYIGVTQALTKIRVIRCSRDTQRPSLTKLKFRLDFIFQALDGDTVHNVTDKSSNDWVRSLYRKLSLTHKCCRYSKNLRSLTTFAALEERENEQESETGDTSQPANLAFCISLTQNARPDTCFVFCFEDKLTRTREQVELAG